MIFEKLDCEGIRPNRKSKKTKALYSEPTVLSSIQGGDLAFR